MHLAASKPATTTIAGPVVERRAGFVFWMVWVFAALLIVQRSAAARIQGRAIKDEDITAAITNELAADDAVPAHLVDVTTEDDVVTLSGSISTLFARDRAAEIVKRTRGVRALVNRIRVRPVKRPDAEIEADVTRALLLDPATDSYEIDVSVTGARVTLTGTVDSWAEKRLAAQVVKGTKGVAAIDNHIEVSYQEDRPDGEIEAEIRRRLESSPYLDEEPIELNVEDGRVTYTGTVGSLLEKSLAGQLGWVIGVGTVDTTNLEIEWWMDDEMRRAPRLTVKSDEETLKAVETALAHDPRVSSFTVGIEVLNGKVTLTGTVDNLMARRAAERDAKNTVGVWQVENQIKVRPVNPPSDSYIRRQVEDSLTRDAVLEQHDLTALARNQKVYLYGEVPTYYARRRAEDVAARVFGVAAVANKIDVMTKPTTRSDAEIEEEIEGQYAWSILVDGDAITVDVKDATVTLRGTVNGWHELKAAVESAFQAGAKAVENKLEVRPATRNLYPQRYYPSLFWGM
jgi:osmotically-inducible protein OsmY